MVVIDVIFLSYVLKVKFSDFHCAFKACVMIFVQIISQVIIFVENFVIVHLWFLLFHGL
jgi:hypothetical protein